MDTNEILRSLSDVSEDLAIELLSQFTKEDFPHLTKTIERLIVASDLLMRGSMEVPYPVVEVLRHYKEDNRLS